MKTKIHFIYILACAIALGLPVTTNAQTQKTFTMKVWPNKPQYKSADKADTAKIFVSLPREEIANGRAVVICPGGGYENLAIVNEGFEFTTFFNRMGVATIVLKYRMPHGDRNVPISDAEEAIRMVRRHAKEWNIDPNDVGIMGSSAGGHLASTLATHSKNDAKPDFQILFYPLISMQPELTDKGTHDRFFGKKVKQRDEMLYSNERQVTRTTPRAFITLASDDQLVNPEHGVDYYLELYRHDVPASIFVYPSGNHGYGSQPLFKFHEQLFMELESWMRSF